MALDSQIVELLGRQRLIGELLTDGVEVAVPARDRGVDLIAYADLTQQVSRFASRPIQMKASTTSGFVIAQKFARIADLIIAYVWHLDDPRLAVTYALPYAEAVKVAEAMGLDQDTFLAPGAVQHQQPQQTTPRPSRATSDVERSVVGSRHWQREERRTTRLSRPLARIRSPRLLNASVMSHEQSHTT